MEMSSRSRRSTALVVLVLLSSLCLAAPAVGAQPAGSRGTGAAMHPGRTPTNRQPVQRRGHIQADRLPRMTSEPGSGASSATRTDGPSGTDSLSVLPPPDNAITGGTVPPVLSPFADYGTGAGDNPVDPDVAVGPDHIASAEGIYLGLFDRSGHSPVAVSFDMFFMLSPGTTFDDGQVYYDAAHGRWVAAEISNDCVPGDGATYGHGYLDFAVSDTANPKLGWSIYYYTYDDQVTTDVEYGSSADKIALTAQFRDMASAACDPVGDASSDITGITWTGLLKGTFTDASYFLFEPNASERVDDLQPAVSQGETTPTLAVLMSVTTFAPAGREDRLFRINGTGLAATGVATPLPVPPFGVPAPIQQDVIMHDPGFGPTGAVAIDGRLVTAVTEPCQPLGDTQTRDCVRVIDVDTSHPALTRRQDFYISATGKETFTPGLAISQTGDLVITYQEGISTIGPAYSAAFVVRQARSDPPDTISARRTLIPADKPLLLSDGAKRVICQPDPLVPDAVWVTNLAGSFFSYSYRTQIAQARSATGDTYKPISPLRVLDTRDGTGGLAGPFLNGVPRTFAVAGAGGGTIPVNAVAITGNVTVAGQTSAGFVSLGPSIGPNPSTSTINFPLGDARANNLTLPLNGQGKLMAVFRGGAGKSSQLILDVTGYFVADDTGASYKPVTSARLLDTRTGNGLAGKLTTGAPRSFQVTGRGGIPAGAKAVTGNLTVVGQTVGGYVSLTPTPNANPTTSTLNFPVGDVRANGVTVPLSGTGMLSAVFKSSIPGTTHLIFDVTGYYLTGTSGLRFFPLNPGRIMDTRTTTLTQLTGAFTNGVPRTLVTGGHFGVPNDALAVTGNLTVASQTYAGYVSITRDPIANPTVSTINFPLGDIRANGATVPLNAANDMALVYKSAKAGAKTHLILDLAGYFR